ncbi:MAG: carboxypeptidase regulatory-like domain-containing protein, partial [Terriglobales bacterium]
MRTTLRLIFSIGTLLLISQFALAQGAATGDLRVTVKDQKGGVVTNATVIVKDVAKGLERAGSGDGEGGYSVRQLAPGTYTVSVTAPGFATSEATDVNITVGQVAELPIGLTVASGKEVVEVTSQAELVETTRTSTTDTIGERKIEDLPINGRNYIQFTLTDSQVVRDNAPSLGGAAPTSGLNISGQRGRSNLVNVDGADATDNSVNGVRSTLSQEAVQEFQILTNSYPAEYGRASGGVVNIITKSGTNAFHGDVFGYLRNRDFQAVNPFSTTSNPAYTRVQAGAAFGGPIKKDKTYYYFGYEITRRHETGFSSIGQDCQQSGGTTCFGLTQFTPLGGDAYLTADQISFITNPTVIAFEELYPAYATEVQDYTVLAGASSGQAINGAWPLAFTMGHPGLGGFPTTCSTPGECFVPGSYQSLASQEGNFPVSEGTSLYSLRLDHNLSNTNRLSFMARVSPSTVTG